MHNIHIVVVKGYKTFEDAVGTAESAIEEWGTENNWFTIAGGFDAEGNRHVNDEDGRFFDGIQTLDQLKDKTKGFFKPNIFCGVENDEDSEMKLLLKRAIASIGKKPGSPDCLTGHEWRNLKNYAEHKRQVADSGVKDMDKFDLFNTELFSFTFDQNGITIIDGRGMDDPEVKIFVLVADVHS